MPVCSPTTVQQIWFEYRFRKKQAGDRSHHDHDEMTVNTKHEFVMREIKIT